MWDMFERGGIMMYPLILSSLLAAAIIIERLITLRRRKIIIPEVINLAEQFGSLKDIDFAKNICLRYEGPLPSIIRMGLDNNNLDRSEIKELLEDQGRQEIRKLRKGLGVLETVAVLAPLMGLLGTVLGMIKVFGVIQEQGVGQAAALSGGISEALLTTVTGLFIGIPVLIFYNYFSHKTENFVLDIEKHSGDLIRKLHRIKSGDENKDRTLHPISVDDPRHSMRKIP
jgi:biopolymer transport protein ExbB